MPAGYLGRPDMRALVLVGLLAVSGWAIASQPPPPAPSETAGKPQQDGAKTESAATVYEAKPDPLVSAVEAIPSALVKEASEEKRREGRDYTDSEWWLVYLTAALAVITGVLAAWTGMLWSATKKMGKEAKDAANAAKDAMIASERAYVFAGSSERFGLNTMKDHLPFGFSNEGRTPAVIVEMVFYPDIRKEAPTSISLTNTNRLPPGITIKSGKDYPVAGGLIVPEKDLTAIQKGEVKLYIVGRIIYRDVFQVERITSFCWEYDIHRGGLKMTAECDMNFMS
ncbi:hypothetical protein [Arenimonas sp.]|uniref:hypothetical protein n=1 Tax=Arenimonas sp. TaxID=1872635 RepID=UPI0039E52C02